ncbi:MAG: ATP-binding cassette domain-containing protein [Puniceicoccales bacterium]|jgi:putative ABC transport system ATP-binding protein|nr:ATP-binding cassette domain-containing protein [Puniceicoccales bacterium]
MLVLKNINVSFNEGTPLHNVILRDVDLRAGNGEFITIIGGNGAGKSSLFNVITGLLRPTRGEIMLDNENVTMMSQHRRSRDVAKVMQDTRAGTMANLTIFENLAFAFMRGKHRKLLPYSTSAREKLLREKLESLGLGLEKRMDDMVENLSGGQRQVISLLMAILAPSKVLLLDEITGALDPKISDNVMALTDKIVRQAGLTTLMITHNMSHAIKYGDRMLLLANHHFLKEFAGEEKRSLSPLKLAEMFGEI